MKTKQPLYLIILCLTLGSCLTSTDNSNQEENKYFEYDAIDYYQTNITNSKIFDIYDIKSKSEIDSFTLGIILNDIPNSISDLAFIDKLEKVGFDKSTVDKYLFDSIDTIFMSKPCLEIVERACTYFYRDILIFKKENKVIGTAKICFSCRAHQIKGTQESTLAFGQNGDYAALRKILKPLMKE